MCGICGVMHEDRSRRVNEARLDQMNQAMAHRGPDDAGLWNGGHVGLAARRLSIIDLFRGHQPMFSDDGLVVVVFNGEIYNFQSLRAELEQAGHVFHTLSDTEVILRAYEQHGDDAVLHLNGMFAFAVYDGRQDRLLVARDRIGIKPLFYTARNGSLAFASEIDALLRSGLVQGRLDPASLDAYFTFLYIPGPDTIFQDVQQLRPGERLVFHKGETRKELYWRPTFQTSDSWTLDSAAQAYVELLEDSVRLQRVSDVPLGAFLSGGMDSTSVLAMLSRMSPAPVKTFTIGFDDNQANELRFARIAAKRFGTDHTEEMLRPEMTALAAGFARHFGQPFADSSAVPTWLVSKVTRQHVTVALSGDGGDELFAGYTWTHMTRKVARYRRLPIVLRLLIDGALGLAPGSPLVAKLRRFSQDSFLTPHACFRRRITCFNENQRADLYTPAMAQLVASCAVDRFQEHAAMAGHISDEDRMLYQDLRMYLPDDILTKVDRMSMAHGLEVRVPLLDHRIVEFAATVPFHLKLEGGKSKRLVKRAMTSGLLAGIVPPALLKQRKQGFAIPIHRWFRDELRAHFEEVVLAGDALNRRFLQPNAVRALLTAHLLRRDNYGHHLWALLMFEHWLRYVDSVSGISLD